MPDTTKFENLAKLMGEVFSPYQIQVLDETMTDAFKTAARDDQRIILKMISVLKHPMCARPLGDVVAPVDDCN